MELPQDKEGYVEHFIRYLRKRGLRYTTERQEVIDILFDAVDHLEAEDILLAIRNKGNRVSRATIYRTLALLAEAGLLKMNSFEHRHTYYEVLLKGHDHDHLVCTTCGKVIEFNEELSNRVQQTICDMYGFKSVRRHFEIVGICPDCQTKKVE
jgi:Fur family ferric uptake transcriptional regulator